MSSWIWTEVISLTSGWSENASKNASNVNDTLFLLHVVWINFSERKLATYALLYLYPRLICLIEKKKRFKILKSCFKQREIDCIYKDRGAKNK